MLSCIYSERNSFCAAEEVDAHPDSAAQVIYNPGFTKKLCNRDIHG